MCVCACVCACVRACLRMCVCVLCCVVLCCVVVVDVVIVEDECMFLITVVDACQCCRLLTCVCSPHFQTRSLLLVSTKTESEPK